MASGRRGRDVGKQPARRTRSSPQVSPALTFLLMSCAPPLAAPSLGALLRERCEKYGDREFLRFEGRSLSFTRVERKSARLARELARHGVGKGDRVAIMLPNGLEYPLVWLAVVRLGAVVVPCNVTYQSRDLTFMLADSGARLAVTDSERSHGIEAVRKDCPALEAVTILGSRDGAALSAIP